MSPTSNEIAPSTLAIFTFKFGLIGHISEVLSHI